MFARYSNAARLIAGSLFGKCADSGFYVPNVPAYRTSSPKESQP